MKDDAFDSKEVERGLIQGCDPWIWILKNSEQNEEVAHVLQMLSFLIQHDHTGHSTVISILPSLLENVDSFSDLVKYFSLKTLKTCLAKFPTLWATIYTLRESILFDLSKMLTSKPNEFISLSLSILRDLTCISDESVYESEKLFNSDPINPRKKRQSLFPGLSKAPNSVDVNKLGKNNAPDPRLLVFSHISPQLTRIIQNPTSWSKTIVHYALGIICNFSVNDYLSQQIAHIPDAIKSIFRLFQDSRQKINSSKSMSRATSTVQVASNMLYSVRNTPKQSEVQLATSTSNQPSLSVTSAVPIITTSSLNEKEGSKPSDTDILLDCLCCFRNLCIDEYACLEILNMASPIFLKMLAENSAHSYTHRVSLSVLRNLVLQNNQCLNRLLYGDDEEVNAYADTGFVDEVVVALSAKNEREGQICAIDIVEKMIKDGGDICKKALIDAGCLTALLIPMNDSKPDHHTEKAAQCFTILKEYQDANMIDIWTRLRNEWNSKDTERAKKALAEAAEKLRVSTRKSRTSKSKKVEAKARPSSKKKTK
ncbi:hypothetical protein HDU79_009581 [Rhizoclosmatium sp. JEL0117]|nr:hypothetical protein HDU79_009581 [Rhizoclosmatium sp. JEL0117]